MTRPALLFLMSGAVGCSASTGTMAADPPTPRPADAATALADAGPSPTVVEPCAAGFAADSRGACTRWTLLADGAPACFDVSMATLHDGRVLVLGNCHDPAVTPPTLLSGFLFDPADRSWRVWPDAPATPSRGSVTLLGDGRVLVAGGMTAGPAAATQSQAILFDASAGATSIVTAAAMETARALHTATLLADGRVLVAGGYAHLRDEAAGETLTATTEIYDPHTDRWQPAAPMRTARYGHTATLLDNGNVVVIGGIDGFGGATPNVEIYNPRSDAWHDGPSLEAIGGNLTATGLADGSVLVLSAEGAFRSFGRVTGFLPATGMLSAREGHFAIAIDEMDVLVVGGVTRAGEEHPIAEIYEGLSGTWHEARTPTESLWSTGPSGITRIANGVLLHSDNIGFLVYDWPRPSFSY